MKVRIINNKIAEVNNPQSPGLVVDLPDELVGTYLDSWLYENEIFSLDPNWVNPDLNPQQPFEIFP